MILIVLVLAILSIICIVLGSCVLHLKSVVRRFNRLTTEEVEELSRLIRHRHEYLSHLSFEDITSSQMDEYEMLNSIYEKLNKENVCS